MEINRDQPVNRDQKIKGIILSPVSLFRSTEKGCTYFLQVEDSTEDGKSAAVAPRPTRIAVQSAL